MDLETTLLALRSEGLGSTFAAFTSYFNVYVGILAALGSDLDFGRATPNSQKVVIEFSYPNANKPLHLGYLRNNF